MTTKQKAEELVEKMKNIPSEKTEKNKIHFLVMKQTAIRQALIAVEEILQEYWSHDTKRREWWNEVKQEIKKL